MGDEKAKRILVFGMTENPGGVETFLLNYYRNIDRTRLQFDFLCNFHGPAAFEEELIAMGGRIYHITARSRNVARYSKELDQVFREHKDEWTAVWVNVSSLANIDYLKAARKYGIGKRIIHSHNSRNMDSRLRGLLHEWNKKRIRTWATDFWACSEPAAKWFYGEGLIPEVRFIHNAIDIERVSFDCEKREAVRKQLGIGPDTFVVGNIGRLHFQKNQAFSIRVFREYVKLNADAKLIFIGQGEDEDMLKNSTGDLKDRVIFAGVQRDIQGWLSAFDLFLFPSLFEGLPLAVLEAQANGLPVLTAENNVTEEVKVTDGCQFFSLTRNTADWAEKMQGMKRITDRESIRKAFRDRGYDIAVEAPKLQRLLTG